MLEGPEELMGWGWDGEDDAGPASAGETAGEDRPLGSQVHWAGWRRP